MNKGGYQIINLGGVNLEQDIPVKIDGVYDKIKGTTKPLLFSGINIKGKEYRDIFTTATVIQGYFRVDIYGTILFISSEDLIELQ